MRKELRKKCAEAIVLSDQKCIEGAYGIRRMTLGDIAEYAAEACIKVYLKDCNEIEGDNK